MSVDPVLTDANTGSSFNRYNYANNNPYRYIDPDGRQAECSWRTGCARVEYGDGGASNSPLPPISGSGPSAGSGAIAGAAAGFTLGLKLSAGCDALTLGGCILANPLIIGGTTLLGGLTGYIAIASSSNSNPGSSSSTPSEGTGDLLSAANKPVNDSGLSAAARALDKHAGRPGGSFAPLTGGVAEKNQAANKFVQGVLTNPTTIRTSLSRGGVEFRLPNGQGVRFNADGALSGFLDPKK